MKNKTIAFTFVELMIGLVLLSIIILGFYAIELYSRYQVLNSDRRTKVQNQVSYVLAHMGKNIALAIGNEKANGAGSAVNTDGSTFIRAYIDGNFDGIRQAPAVGSDYWIAYRYYTLGPNAYKVRYCSECQNAVCNACSSSWEDVALNISGFGTGLNLNADNTLQDNFADVNITGCWDASGSSSACGSADNPTVNMTSRILMPSVSTN